MASKQQELFGPVSIIYTLLYIYLTVLILLDWRNFENYAGTWCVADTGGRIHGRVTINGPNFHGFCRKAKAVDSCCVNTDVSNTFVMDSSDGC